MKDPKFFRLMGLHLEADRLEKNLCPTCGGAVFLFRDVLSRREFAVSGMCQLCQDRFFHAPTQRMKRV